MSWSRLLVLVLIVALAVPAALLGGAPGSTPAPVLPDTVAAPRAPGPSAADAAGPHRKGEKKRKREARQADRARHSRQKQAPPSRLPERARDADSSAPSKRERKRLWEEKCDGPGSVKLPKSRECTHGGDPAPPGFSITRPVAPLTNAAARAAAAGVECDGDGQSGPRLQVLYAHASDVASQYSAFLPSFRAWTAEADAILQESAAEVGGSRHFRLATTACAIDVTEVILTPSGDGAFDNTIAELKAQGYNRTNRKYLIFVDTTAAGICGIASIWDDDDPRQTNWNNHGPSYARVDAGDGCWDDFTAAHEIMHTLGGVQDSAPNASGGDHCIDEYDVMCYSDPPFHPAMRYDCPQQEHDFRYDCGHQDYFHPAPADGSYLDTHWNTADNRFLIGGGNGGDDDGLPPAISWVAPVGDGETYRAASGSVTLEATASDDVGVNRVQFWRLDESSGEEEFVLLAVDRTAPYTTTLNIADLNPGLNLLNADAYDGAQNWTFRTIWIERTTPDLLTITAPRNGVKVKAKKPVTLTAQPSSALTGVTGVEFRVCSGGSCTWSAGRSLRTDASAPYSARWKAPKSGSATFLAQVTHDDSAELSDPVTVSVKKAKKKKKR